MDDVEQISLMTAQLSISLSPFIKTLYIKVLPERESQLTKFSTKLGNKGSP